jgi:hypothetical protein
MTQLEARVRVTHVMSMHGNDISSRNRRPGRASQGSFGKATFGADEARGPIIDQDGREVPPESLEQGFREFRFDFASANPFGNLSREQRVARLEAIAKLLDVAFILPGTKVRYGIDGIIGLIPVVGDIIVTGLSLWLVHEARALGAPWHVTARMLGNVAFQGVVGSVPVAGDAIDILYRANMRNARILRRWLEKRPS